MWSFDKEKKEYSNNCDVVDRCCWYCRESKECSDDCRKESAEKNLIEEYGLKIDCNVCKHYRDNR